VAHDELHALREALKLVAVALKECGVPFALAGGYAVWAQGGPEPDHDVDFVIAEEDVAQAMEHLAASGLQVTQPPEDWLFKVYVDHALVDVIFRRAGVSLTRADLEEAELADVGSVAMPVLPATRLLTDKLGALGPHSCDFGALLAVARAVREQVDWEAVRQETAGDPYAEAFLFLLERLEVVSRG
jgi:hypothetical protein